MGTMRATKTEVDQSLRETKMHGTEGFPIGVYLDDFSDFENGYICWHWHEEVQVTMIIEGRFLCQIEGNDILMKEGEILFINAGLLHQIRPEVPARGKLYSFIWKPELICGNRKNDVYKECVAPVLQREFMYAFWNNENPEYNALQRDLQQIVLLYEEKKAPYQLQIVNKLSKFWLMLFDKMPKDEKKISQESIRDEQRVKAALQFMQEHYQESLHLDQIAEAAFISRSELCRSFQRTLHVTPMEFLMQFRIRQASVLLKNPKYRILDVAEIVGFSSPSHFGTYFLKYMGCTPRAYRTAIMHDI